MVEENQKCSKMEDNLFARLSKYSTGNVTPEENFFTEAFAWILSNNPDIAVGLLKEISGINFNKKNLKIKTQVYYEHSNNNVEGNASYIDLQIEDENNLLFIENKISAELNKYSSKNEKQADLQIEIDQIEKYEKLQNQLQDNRYKKVIAIVLSKKSYHSKKDKIVSWSQIYDFIDKYKNEKPFIQTFLEFMEFKGMSSFKGFKQEFFNSLAGKENSYYDERTLRKTFEDFTEMLEQKVKTISDKNWHKKIYSRSNTNFVSSHFAYPNKYSLNINVETCIDGMGNEYKGQFFTPYHICQMMTQVSLINAKEIIKEKGYIAVSEPCSGAGGMIIAAREVLLNQGCNPSTDMFVEAIDVDDLCFKMTYIQLSLLGIPARVVRGNTLSMEFYEVLYTPLYFIKGWHYKLKKSEMSQESNLQENAIIIKPVHEGLTTQLSLF